MNDDELGSLENAVRVGTKLSVVLRALERVLHGAAFRVAELGHLTGLLGKIEPSVEGAACRDPKQDACVSDVARRNVLRSMAEIRARSPYLARALDEDRVDLIGGMYDVSTGRVEFFEK
ncbi:MAG: carbonic anhydrase [Myxococcota bacterium]